jgi:hypothetical protein
MRPRSATEIVAGDFPLTLAPPVPHQGPSDPLLVPPILILPRARLQTGRGRSYSVCNFDAPNDDRNDCMSDILNNCLRNISLTRL